MPDKLRVGVIGVGFGATVHIPAFQSEGLEVVAVCTRREERAKEAAAKFKIPHVYTDYRKMLEQKDIDVVSVVTPHALHREHAEATLAAGKHVICEKAFALNVDEARSMWHTAQKSKKTAMIAHEFRWSPQRQFVKELLGQGYIGKLRLVQANLLNGQRRATPPRAMPETDLGLRGGMLWGLGSHYIDGMRHWFGDITRVQATMRAMAPDRASPDGSTKQVKADDTFLLVLEFANGGIGVLTASQAAPFGPGASIEVFGDQGSLYTPQGVPGMNPPSNGKVFGARIGDAERRELPMPQKFVPFEDPRDDRLLPFRLQVREFVKGVREGTSPAPNFEDGYRCQQVLDAAVKSATTGHAVSIGRE
ncbi:MAG: Gfo/Idh/MocA family oxidoreductase [Dehalococcoidia bacterium]|nr:Gfo/Idh/MocA family oxidoreductase [Dehalococcoidia bacterium]